MSQQVKGYIVLGFIVALVLVKPFPVLTTPLLIAVACFVLWFVVGWIVDRIAITIKPKYRYKSNNKYKNNLLINQKQTNKNYPKTGTDFVVGKLPDDFVPTPSARDGDRDYRDKARQLERELRQLVKDNNAVNRLLASAKAKYPDRTYSWQVDKVLSDWLRDRQ